MRINLNEASSRKMQGVEFWAANTDAQALDSSEALNKIQMGAELTRGLGEHTFYEHDCCVPQ